MILQEIWSGESLKTKRSLKFAWLLPLCSSGNPLQFASLQAIRRNWALEEIFLCLGEPDSSSLQRRRWYPGRGSWEGGNLAVTPEELRLVLGEKLDLPASSLPTCHSAHKNHLSQPPAPGWLRRSRHSAEDILNQECVHFSLAPGQIAPSQFCSQGWAFL